MTAAPIEAGRIGALLSAIVVVFILLVWFGVIDRKTAVISVGRQTIQVFYSVEPINVTETTAVAVYVWTQKMPDEMSSR